MRSSILSRLGYFLLRSGVVLPRVDAVDRYYEQNHLRDLLRRLNINCLLDVGAYIGWFAKHLRMVGYDDHIVSFEPNRVSCDVLRENARGDDKWHVFNLALGSQDTTMPLNVIRTRAGTDLSSFLGATTFEVDGTETVNVR